MRLTAWGWGLVAALLLVPTWPIVAGLLTVWDLHAGVPPILLLYTVPLLLAAGWIGTVDRWAGIFAAYVILRGLPYPLLAFETVVAILAGLAIYAAARSLPAAADGRLQVALVLVGAFTVGVQVGERINLALGWWTPVGGAIGNPGYVGGFLAITGAIAPAAALPLFAVGLLATHSAAGLGAFLLALALRFRARGAAVLGLVGTGALLALRSWPPGLLARLIGWRLGLTHWWAAPVFGWGWAGWLKAGVVVDQHGAREWFAQAHNDWLQLLHDGGLVGLGLVLCWLWVHRPALGRSPWLPAVAAAGLNALWWFPFQIPAVALVALVALARAAREACPHPTPAC